jgi:membrane protein implicated in regulation of membrane protease activity
MDIPPDWQIHMRTWRPSPWLLAGLLAAGVGLFLLAGALWLLVALIAVPVLAARLLWLRWRGPRRVDRRPSGGEIIEGRYTVLRESDRDHGD